MTDQLPEVGSVWRHNETGVIREFLGKDGAWVDVRSTDGCRSLPAKAWLDWQAHATRLDAVPPPLTLEEAEYILRIVRSETKEPEEQAIVSAISREAVRKHDYDYRKSLAHWLRDYINGRGKQ